MANTYERYDPAVKAKFLAAALEAREAGKTFEAAYECAKEAGYKGSVGDLAQVIRQVGLKAKKDKKKAAKAEKAVVAAAPAAPAASARGGHASTGMESIHATIAQVVKERVDAAIKKAIAALEAAKA